MMTGISKYAVFSVMGSHAGESESEIFTRKIQDVGLVGITFWLIKSHKAKPEMVQNLCKAARTDNANTYCVFIEASSSKGAIPTKTAEHATNYSADSCTWKPLPIGLTPVTGKIDKAAFALVFDKLEMTDGTADLWRYADFFNQSNPLRIAQGASTICAIEKEMRSHPDKIKSPVRRVIALGRLCEPYCVYLQ